MCSNSGVIPVFRSPHATARRIIASLLGLFFLTTALLKANAPMSTLVSVKSLMVKLLGLDPSSSEAQTTAIIALTAIVIKPGELRVTLIPATCGCSSSIARLLTAAP